MVKFGYTINYVSDVEKALTFFEHAFAIKRKFITDEKDYGELETGETVLSFASHESNFQGGYVSASESKEPLGIEIALVTDDVDLAHNNALKFGAIELKSPQSKPWGQVVSYVRCPSGILLELCSPIGS